jgi:hypothetical protein
MLKKRKSEDYYASNQTEYMSMLKRKRKSEVACCKRWEILAGKFASKNVASYFSYGAHIWKLPYSLVSSKNRSSFGTCGQCYNGNITKMECHNYIPALQWLDSWSSFRAVLTDLAVATLVCLTISIHSLEISKFSPRPSSWPITRKEKT